MNRWRSLSIATIVFIALSTFAQQPTTAGSDREHSTDAGNVEQHMSVLTERLSLTADQQAKIRPVVQAFLENRQKLVDDKTLSDTERMNQIGALHAKAMNKLSSYLTDEQKKKLDELQQESHAQGHTN